MSMRTEADQIKGLRVVQLALYESGAAAVADIAIVLYLGDVVQLRMKGTASGSNVNVVYAADGYDGWANGDLVRTDMTAGDAAEWLVSQSRKAGRE